MIDINKLLEDFKISDNDKEKVKELLEVFTKELLEVAAENAKTQCGYVEDEWGMNRSMLHRVDKYSIIRIIDKINF